MISVRHLFDEGTLVRHGRYGCRRVAVALDAVRNEEPWRAWS